MTATTSSWGTHFARSESAEESHGEVATPERSREAAASPLVHVVTLDCKDAAYVVERWRRWQDLDALLKEKVVPALPMYNPLLKRPFVPAKDTLRITLRS